MARESYQVLIIGGGQAGVPLARGLAARGLRVAVAERQELGGSCVNFGCTPTKAALASARVAHLARRAREFGLRVPRVEVDLAAVLDRARGILIPSRAGIRESFHGPGKPTLLSGHARLAGRAGKRFRVQVGADTFLAEQVVLNTGTRTRVPEIPGLDEVDFLHAGNWLDRPELPEHLIVLGAGFVGLEMAQFYRRMGSRVTVVDRGPQIADEDEDVARALRQILEGEDIRFLLGAKVRRIRRRADGALGVRVAREEGGQELSGSHLFVATGRLPNTDDLGLETVGVERDREGLVPADERLATGVAGLWAAGDIRGGGMFTHTAWDDHRVLLSQIAGDGRRTCARPPLYAIFTDPELGRVGESEAQARRRLGGRRVRVGRYEMRNNGRAREHGESEGFVKVVVDADSERLLGAAVLASAGAEIVHCFVDVMRAGASFRAILDAVHIHPTYAEAVQSAVAALQPPEAPEPAEPAEPSH